MRRIILISEGKIFLAPSRPFPVSITTFPADSVTFGSKVHQYWEVEATNDSGNLTFLVTNYHPTNVSAFDTQGIKGVIKSITFKSLDWQQFQRLLVSYKPNAIHPFLDSSTVKNRQQPIPDNLKQEKNLPNVGIPSERMYMLQEREETYEEEFQVSYEEARFRNGYVEFTKSFKWFSNPITIRIDNPFIREEFEAIKSYFAKVVNGRKKFTAFIKVKK